MSSFFAREMSIWKNTLPSDSFPVEGDFVIVFSPAGMVNQTVQFLAESIAGGSKLPSSFDPLIRGMRNWSVEQFSNCLLYSHRFDTKSEYSNFDRNVLPFIFNLIEEIEVQFDISMRWIEIHFLANFGRPLEHSLVKVTKKRIVQGVGFEVEHRGAVANNLKNGSIELSSKVALAQRHYSTGMSLLGFEDQMPGIFDGAFMQFYQAIEVILGEWKQEDALENGRTSFGSDFPEKVVQHVFDARNAFFAHSSTSNTAAIRAGERTDAAFDIAKQLLVARWAARKLISLELGVDLPNREVRLYPNVKGSICFSGEEGSLDTEFRLP